MKSQVSPPTLLTSSPLVRAPTQSKLLGDMSYDNHNNTMQPVMNDKQFQSQQYPQYNMNAATSNYNPAMKSYVDDQNNMVSHLTTNVEWE